MATIGLGQDQKDHYQEKPIVTSGDDIARIVTFLKENKFSYSAEEVIEYLLSSISVGLSPIAV
jgi:hypothetical protein